MSEIDGKSSELSFLSSFFADQESCSVAAAISSALETAAEDHSIINSHINNNNQQHHHPHPQDPNQHFFQQPYQQYNNQQINFTTDNNNHHCFRFGDLVKTTTGESLVNNFVGQQQQLHHHQQEHQQEPIYHPVAPFYEQGHHHPHHHQQHYENHYQEHTHNINSNNHQPPPTLLSCNTNSSAVIGGGGGSRRSGSTNKSTAEGNHVSGGDTFTISRSSCSQQFHHQQKTSTLSSQMADKQDYSNSNPASDKTTSSPPVRDKSDNRETYQVSHQFKEKPTCDKREVDSGGGGGGGASSRGVFKPSSKIIDLPEKSTSSAHDHHHSHHHHSSSRGKDSKIPVGIAVAWQRLVTTSSSSPGVTSTMTTKAGEGGGAGVGGKGGKMGGGSCNINTTSKYPSRPSSATSLKSSTVKQNHPQNNNNSNLFSASSNGYSSASNPNLSMGVENTSDILSSRPMSACGDAVLGALGGVSYCPSPAASPVLSRPLPSSSVPPNIGYPTGSYHPSSYPTHHNPYHSPHHPHHRQAGMSPYLDYPYGVAAAAAAQRGFAVPSPLTSPHHHHSHPNLHPSYWGMDAPPPVPLMSQGIHSSPSGVASPADYLQQLSSLQQQHQQQQMHLHHSPQNPHHPLHQQHLLASAAAAAANRQISSSPSPSSSPYGPAAATNQYLQFLYPPSTSSSSSSSSQEAASMAASVAAATAAMNKSPYYDHYFLQHQQNLLQQQHQQNLASVNSSSNSGSNTSNSVTTSGAFDLLANNNTSSGGSGSSQQHRAIPMQVASPINRTTTPQLSCSPTVSGEIRTPTPTTKSSSSSSVNLAATTTVGAAAKAASSSSTSDAAPVGCVTSSVGGSGSAASTFSLATTTAAISLSHSPSSTTSTSQHFVGSSQSSAAGAPPLTISRPQQESCPSPSSLFLLHHQQQHPHLFATSSAALSPKSLTSSTPSPVTVHDFNSGLNVIISSCSPANNTVTSSNNMAAAATRKGASPSPVSLTPTRALLSPFPPGSPFCPSPIPSNNNNNNGSYKELLLWKDDSSSVSKIKPIPINGQTRETHVRTSGSRHASGGSSLTTPPPLCSPLLSIAHHNNMKNNKVISVSTPMSSPSGGQKHDFKRLESLIERRDSESISPLVLYPQHSPATSTASSVVDPDETFQQIGRPFEQEQEMCGRRDDDEDEMGTFRVSVKLEKAECQVHQRDDDDEEREVDESFKVKPTTTSKVSEMIRHTDHKDGHADQKAEGICMVESDGERKEKAAAVKVEFLSPVIRSCDEPTNKKAAVEEDDDDSKTQSNEIVEGNDVPESTLPLLCSGMSRSISNYDNSFTDDDDNDKRNDKKASNLSTIKDNKQHHQQQTVKDKDVSFTSGYSSSHEDNNDNTFIIGKQPITGAVAGKKKSKKCKGEEEEATPSLKLPSYKIRSQKKDKKNTGVGKANKKEKKEKVSKKVVPSLETAVKSKKTLKVSNDVAKKDSKKKGKGKEEEDELANNLEGKKTKKKYSRKKSESDVADKQSEKIKKKATPKKEKKVAEEKVVVPKKNKGGGGKGVKQTKMGKQGSINSQQQSWAPTISSCGVVTNYQQQCVNSSDNHSGSYFVSPNVTIAGGSSGGDISCTASGNANPDQSNVTSLTSNPIQPPPMAVLLHHQKYQPTSSSAAPTALHTPPTQVTFLITSPDRTVSGTTSPLRIPAYIPRSGTTTSCTTNAAVEDLVGEGYNGPATLTLHRDVDAGASVVSPQSSYYSHHLPNHPPPAITIQYHHSAPSTPLTMEAASPSSLDLLATVAQEFGSREDLGKRHSIDGGSSCNTSILGESPPMSPQKSPASYHHPPPIQHPNHFPHHFSSNTTATTTLPSLHVPPTTSQKSVTLPAPIVVPPPPQPLQTCVPFGKRPKSPKKTQSKSSRKSPSVKQRKTSNSITLKQTSKKVKKMIKAGKKEKRTVSDSAAALYTPPVVYLKIPQVPGLCSKKKGTAAAASQEKATSVAKKTKTKVKPEVGELLSKKSKQINNTNKDKPVSQLKLNKNAVPKDHDDNTDNVKKKKNNKTKEDKAEKKAGSKKSLAALLPNLPISSSTASKAEKGKEPKRSSTKTPTKKEKKNKLVEGGIISTLLPLNTTITTTASSPPTFSKDHHQITGNLTTTTPSPTKDKPSSFYNPPERISAFAKQVISRRSSTVGGGSVSPTKPTVNNTTTSSSLFFPTQQQKQTLLPNSPTIKMPQLTPYDALSPPTPTSPDSSSATAVATASLIPLSSISSDSRDRDSSPVFSTVPKVVNLMRFPPSSSINSSGNHLPPPLLLPSVNSKDKKDYCDDVNDDDDVEDARRISMISGQAEQAKRKTDRHRSPISSNKISVKGKKRKDNGRLLEAEDEPLKKKKKRKRRLSSSQEDGDDNDDHPTSKKDKPKKKKKDKSESLAKSKKVPKITFTPTHSTTRETGGPSSSLAFSPLTPPLTAKFSSSSLEGDEGIGKEPRKSAFASLQVPHSGSTTPCSSLHSCKSSSPSCCVNVEDSGETETENENDFSNVWVADPMFAVSAIKVSTLSSPVSNQPTDVEEEEEIDDSVQEEDDNDDANANLKLHKKSVGSVGGGSLRKKGSKLPKLSLSAQQHKTLDRESVLDVNSQFSKAFVHFKPKELTSSGGKKGNHGSIKPCLKAEPIIVHRSSRSLEENDEDVVEVENDDEDFQLDMEVANITTKNNNRNQSQNAPKKVEKAATSSTATSAATATAIASTATNKKIKPSINRNSSSYLVKHQSLSTKEIMTKVFSRKLSPDLNERKSKLKRRRSSAGMGGGGATGHEMDADDEDDEEEELLDIEAPSSSSIIFSSKSSHQSGSSNAHISMSAAAQAVIVNSSTNQSSASSTPALSSSSLALLSSSPMKKPKKRSARSSTTSSSASTKSSSQRGNRGQSSSGIGGGVSASVFSSTSTMTRAAASASSSAAAASQQASKDEIQMPGKVELDSVGELVDEMRILTDIQGLFYTGRLNALQPPDVYGVTLDNERGAPPHLIFSAEEVLEKCLREKKPQNDGLRSGVRICAYWSPQYSGLYPGRVSSDFSPKFDPEKDLIPIEFDDGDTGMIKLKEIRLLSVNHPVREYDPNPLLTLEKKHRKRRHSSATGTSGGCTGDHEEPDCGEPYCAKIGKLEEDDEDDDGDNDDGAGGGGGSLQHHSKVLYWTWSGLGYKTPKNKKNRNKEFFRGIQRGNEVINVGDAALFISTGNERPFIGRVERFWESKGKKMVNVRWFYHPEEVKASAKRLSNLKYPGALFESPHIDENDVQTIAKKCDVLPFPEFKNRLSGTSTGSLRPAKLSMKSSSKPRDMYYVAGYYDPYTYNLTLKDLK